MTPFLSPTQAAPPARDLAKDNTAFALDLYQKLRTAPGNLFLSPYSISAALAMTRAGARGQTEREMRQVLHLATPQTADAFAALAGQLAGVQKQGHVSLDIANSLWCDNNYSLAEDFLKAARTGYQAEVRSVDFRTAADASRQEINAWVERTTHEKIKNLLQPGAVTAATKLILCNAIYFKGDWASPFDPKRTAPAPFFIAADRSVTAPLMTQKLRIKSLDAGDFNLFELAYASNELSMIVFLPKATNGLPGVEQQLDASHLFDWLASLDQRPEASAIVYLPRFQTTCQFELGNQLAQMGMPSAFSPAADFSGMTGRRDLLISGVIHKAFIDVNEKGSEAAAATAVIMKSMAMVRTPILRVDHPFLFLIRERQTGSVLFLGRIENPTQWERERPRTALEKE